MLDKIAAVATGWARSGIGVIRMSGSGCIEAAETVFSARSGRPLRELPDRRLVLGTLRDAQGRPIDQCLAFISRAPHSYTGEDTAEFQCHGSPAALAAALESLFAAGFRQARPGEFTRRAFVNGQMDLTQAEAVIDLIDAETADAAANAAGQLAGSVRARIDPIFDAYTDVCAHFHAVLDYPDEDLPPFTAQQIERTLADGAEALSRLLSSFGRGRVVKSGVRAVILGSPNAGKSSLLNALAGFERVIVTEIPGTTRDTVEQTVRLGRHLVRLTDTAGIRQTDDRIERQGVERSVAAAQSCDVALLVVDGSKALTQEDLRAMETAGRAPVCVTILNKRDLPHALEPEDLPFARVVPACCKAGEGLDALERAFDALFPDDVPCDGSLLTNERQAGAVRSALEASRRALEALRAQVTPDAVLLDVEAAMQALGEVTGRTVREEITDRIFARFCVGK